MITLVDHFKKIITEITDGKWSHLPSKWISKKDKQKLYAADRTQVQRVLDMDPEPFFLAYHRLGEKLYRLREKVVAAFREIKYEDITPLITKVFGSTDFIGIEDSGINELFKPPRRVDLPKLTPRSANVRTSTLNISQRLLLLSVTFVARSSETSACESSSVRPIII